MLLEELNPHKHPLASMGKPRTVRNRNGRSRERLQTEKETIRMTDLVDPIARYVRAHGGYAEIEQVARMVEREFIIQDADEYGVKGPEPMKDREADNGRVRRWVQALNNLFTSLDNRRVEKQHDDIVRVVGVLALATRQYCEDHGLEYDTIEAATQRRDERRAARAAAQE